MKKLLYILFCLPFLASAGHLPTEAKKQGMRFSINGLAGRIPVTAEFPGRGWAVRKHPVPYGEGTGRIDLHSPRFLDREWKRVSVSFTPALSGIISLCRSHSDYVKGVVRWVETRNLKITGAELIRSQRAKLNTSPAGIERMCSRAPLYDEVLVRKGQKVTVTFEARTAASDPESAFSRRDWWIVPPEYKVGWQDNKIQLLAPEDKGYSFAHCGKGANYLDCEKMTFDKPADKQLPRENFSVPVELLEEEGISRRTTVRFGFPLPEKAFRNVNNIALLDASGKRIPADVYAVGYWPDRSVKWALIEFDTFLKAKEKVVFTVKGGRNVSALSGETPAVVRRGKSFHVSTGSLSAVVDPASDALLKNITCGGKSFGDLKLRAGKNAGSRIFNIRWETPSCVRIDGNLVSDSYIGGYTARLFFRKDASYLRAVITYRADNLTREINELESLHLLLTAGKGRLSSGGIFQGDDLKYTANGRTYPGFMPERDLFSSAAGKVSFALADAGRRYPKAFAAADTGLDIQLLPPQPSADFNSHLPGYLRFPCMGGKYRLMAGMNFTEEILFDFSGAPVSAGEVVAVIPASWHACAEAVRGVFGDETVRMFDANAVKEFYAHLKLKAHQREYGFLNWGDWFGERGGNWGNNEYDFAYGLLTLFARTGNRDIYRWGIRAARHQSDVDIIHAAGIRNFIGGNYMHCVGHSGRRSEPGGKPMPWFGGAVCQGYAVAVNGHSWAGGMFMASQMSGRADIGDSARSLAAQFMLHSSTAYRNQGNPRSHGWMLEGLMQAYDATGDDKYLKAGKRVADSFFSCQALDKGGAWPHDLPPGYLRGGRKKGFGTSCFQMGVVIQALHHYSLRANRPEIRKNMAAAAGWMRKAFIPGAVGWPYVAGWDGSAYWSPSSALNMLMLAAACADGDPAGEEILLSGLGFYMLRGVGSAGIGKNLAMDLVFAPAAFEMLKKMPGKRVLTPQAFVDHFAGVPHLMRLRGPEKMKLDLTLQKTETTLFFTRSFYNPRKNSVKEYQVIVKDRSGRTVYSFKGSVDDRRDLKKSCVLKGRAGDRFDIFITDNISSYWEVYTSDRTPVRVHVSQASQFSNGVSLFFGVRVPAGVKKFTLKYAACHPGNYGVAAIDRTGRIIQIHSRYSSSLQLPWLRESARSRCDVTIERKDAAGEDFYRFFTWSAGDVLLDLEGVPEVLEFCH